MKIAVFFPSNQYCSWSMSYGIGAALRRMGHTVLDVIMPTSREASQQELENIRHEKPKLEEIAKQDLLIVSGPEHVGPWIEACYSRQRWEKLSVPKAAWLHESCQRADYVIDVDTLKWMAEHFFFAGYQDADFHDQAHLLKGQSHWLPLGVDTGVFKPYRDECRGQDELYGGPPKSFDCAFIGLRYPKRQMFLQAISRHNHPPIRMGGVQISDLHGYDHQGTAERLASNYRQIKVFFNLPAMSNMLVSKVTEVMACGTFLLTPNLPDDGAANMKPFKSGEHLVYYAPSNLPYIAQLLREWPSPEKDAELARIAAAGCREVHEKHNLTVRMATMLEMANISLPEPVGASVVDEANPGRVS